VIYFFWFRKQRSKLSTELKRVIMRAQTKVEFPLWGVTGLWVKNQFLLIEIPVAPTARVRFSSTLEMGLKVKPLH